MAEHAIVMNSSQSAGLIYKGRILKDDQTLQRYGLEADHTLHMVRGFAPATSAKTGVATNGGAANSTQARIVGSSEGGGTLGGGGGGGSGFGASPFLGLGLNGNGMGGTGGLFGDGFPDFEQMTQNANVIRDMMNVPAIQNNMNNPDICGT
ncbi:hypothetical protein ACFX19_027383 [Malus domestica]